MAQAPKKPQSSASLNRRLRVVVDLLKKGLADQAEKHLATLRLQFPQHPQVQALSGEALGRLDRLEEATRAYQKALEANYTSSELLYSLADVLAKQERHQEALPLLKKIIEEHPNNTKALVAKANSLTYLNELAQARSYYMRALALDPTNASLYLALTHLTTATADSPIFEVLKKHAESSSLSPKDRAITLAAVGKAYLDIGDDEQAFNYYEQANQIMDESLPPIQTEIEGRLTFTRHYFTPSLFEEMSPFGLKDKPQIIIAGMSRSGKSLVESLFNGVKGVSLAGEELILDQYRIALLKSYQGRMSDWLTDLTPETLQKDAATYLKKLQQLGNNDHIKVTTVPGDLWNLGLIGLWFPETPIIFCVRDTLDVGVTGYFQQYDNPEGNRYSYNQHQLGRQIASYEKVMEHWAQVLPNPVYLVDYAALTRDPQTVMDNLLTDLGLEREQNYADIVGVNAELLDTLSPITSANIPLPITDKFNGFAQRFISKLQPMIEGYRSIVDEFPRLEPPAAITAAIPEQLHDYEASALPSETINFDWQLPSLITVIDNGAQLLNQPNISELMALGAFGVVAFDPTGERSPSSELQQHQQLQYVPQMLLGDGQPATLYACLDPKYSSTLTPLPTEQLAPALQQPMQVLTHLSVPTYALDAIDGLGGVDWLLLDARHSNVNILEHGPTTLPHTLLMQVKIDFQALYQNQPTFNELVDWATKNGFSLYTLTHLNHSQSMPSRTDLAHQPEGTTLQQATALFIPNSSRLASLSETQCVKLAFLLDAVYQAHDFSYRLLHQVSSELGNSYLKARGYFDHRLQGPSRTEIASMRKELQSGEHAYQAELLQHWLKHYPKDTQVHCLRAELASWQINPLHALLYINQTTNNAPDDLQVRLIGVEILLRSGLWWEANRIIEAIQQRLPKHPKVQYLAAQVLAVHPNAESKKINKALQYLSSQTKLLSSDNSTHDALQLNVKARLHAHNKQWQQALSLHNQAFDLLKSKKGAVYTQLLLGKANTLYDSGAVDESCNLLWQACAIYPYTPYTGAAHRKLTQRLALCEQPELIALAALRSQTEN